MVDNITSDWNSFWQNQLQSKPINGGFNPNSQNIEAQAGGSVNAPTAMGTNSNTNANSPTAQTTAPSPLASPTVGNTQNSGVATAQGITQSNSQLLNQSNGSNNSSSSGSNVQQPTGLSGFSNIIGSLGGNALNKAIGGTGSSLIGSAGNALNSFGETLGFGSGVPAAAYGPSAAGASEAFGPAYQGGGSLTSTTLGGVLGGAAGGAGIGALYGNLTGAQGGHAIGADIGGAVGGGLGAAFLGSAGATLGTAAIASELGATIGSIVPGLGTILGAVGGAALGSLFGNGTAATSATTSSFRTTADGQKTGEVTGSKNNSSDVGVNIDTSFSNVMQAASRDLGIKFNTDVSIGGGYNSMYSPGGASAPYFVGEALGHSSWSGGQFAFTPTDATSVATAYFKTLTSAAKDSGYTDTQSLYNWFYGQGPITNSTDSNASNTNISIAPRVS